MKFKILPKQFRLALLICAAFAEIIAAFQPYSVSLQRIRSAVRSIGRCDSLILVSVDKNEINHGVGTKPKDGSVIKKAVPKPVYHGVPVLEIATITDRQAIQKIGLHVLNGLDRKPIAIAACVSWVGTLFIYTNDKETKIDFDDLNGYTWLEKGGNLYQIYGSPTIWTEIMTEALGQPSVAEGPCHETAKVSWSSN